MGTKHAVHILREKIGSPATQQKKSVLFQDLLPEHTLFFCWVAGLPIFSRRMCTACLVPIETGSVSTVDTEPVSMGTKHAVHILREKIGSPATQQKKSVLLS
jgi:hypothetical protein